jgi:hypothetical protein
VSILGFALGDPTPADLQATAAALVRSGPVSTLSAKAYYLVLPKKSWGDAGLALINAGVTPAIVYEGMRLAKEASKIPWKTIAGVAPVASAAISGFHGARRNDSIGWGAWWFTMGLIFPIFTPIVGVAQGLGKRKER